MTERVSCRLLVLLAVGLISPSRAEVPEPPIDEKFFGTLKYRHVGPYRGGRVTAVTGIPEEPLTYFFGATGGGVWQTDDGGHTWQNITDGFLNVGSIGAITVAPSDSAVIYVGTGSACPRGNVSMGDGMYRSTDGGETWNHIGLKKAGLISRIRVHPDDPDRVYAAVLGNIFGPNPERGVFRSTTGEIWWWPPRDAPSGCWTTFLLSASWMSRCWSPPPTCSNLESPIVRRSRVFGAASPPSARRWGPGSISICQNRRSLSRFVSGTMRTVLSEPSRGVRARSIKTRATSPTRETRRPRREGLRNGEDLSAGPSV